MVDLYPDENWNFVFGQASLSNRIGVFSFARYTASFYGEEDEDIQIINKRSCRVCVHEIGHQFGLHHWFDFWGNN